MFLCDLPPVWELEALSAVSGGQNLRQPPRDGSDSRRMYWLLPQLCGLGVQLPHHSESLVLDFCLFVCFLSCPSPSLGLSFPSQAVGAGQGVGDGLPAPWGGGSSPASDSPGRLHTPSPRLCHRPLRRPLRHQPAPPQPPARRGNSARAGRE